MFDAGEVIRKLALNMARLSRIEPLAEQFIGGVGAILMLHRVTDTPERPAGINRHLTIAPAFLDALIGDLRQQGFEFVTVCEAMRRLQQPGSPRFLTLTADDAYRDNLTDALPILERHGVPLTVYVAPALIDGTAYLWWEVVEEIVDRNTSLSVRHGAATTVLEARTASQKYAANAWLHDYFGHVVSEQDRHAVLGELAAAHGVDPDHSRRSTIMTWAELATFAAHPLATLGAHSVNHYNLRRLDEATALAELRGSADIIEARTGRRPPHLAYPYGYPAAVSCREVRLAREAGFVSAVTTRHGVLRPDHASHLHALPRISVNGRYQKVRHVRTMLSGVTTPLANAGRLTVTV